MKLQPIITYAKPQERNGQYTISQNYLVMVISELQRLRIFFESDLHAKALHDRIIDLQGYSNNRVGQYALLKWKAYGSFGEVFTCKHVNSKLNYAVKRINKTNLRSVYEDEY